VREVGGASWLCMMSFPFEFDSNEMTF